MLILSTYVIDGPRMLALSARKKVKNPGGRRGGHEFVAAAAAQAVLNRADEWEVGVTPM